MTRATSSLPLWGRGLKPVVRIDDDIDFGVAPLVGAWIETAVGGVPAHPPAGRSPCGGVD